MLETSRIVGRCFGRDHPRLACRVWRAVTVRAHCDCVRPLAPGVTCGSREGTRDSRWACGEAARSPGRMLVMLEHLFDILGFFVLFCFLLF